MSRAGESTDQITAFFSGDARKRFAGTEGAHADQDIFTLGMGFVAFGTNVQIPSGGPRVSVMQPTNLRNRDHLSFGGMFRSARHGSVSIQGKMRAGFVIVGPVAR